MYAGVLPAGYSDFRAHWQQQDIGVHIFSYRCPEGMQGQQVLGLLAGQVGGFQLHSRSPEEIVLRRPNTCWDPGGFDERSSCVSGTWPDQQFDQRAEQRLAPLPDVVHELEEAQVQRQLLLRDPSMGTQPRPQQRPEALHRVDVDLAEPVAVIVPGELPGRMADALMCVAAFVQSVIDVVLIRVDRAARGDRRQDQRPDRDLLHIGQHPDDHLAGPLDHPEDRWLLLLQGPPARGPLQASAAGLSPFFLTASGCPLCPATT